MACLRNSARSGAGIMQFSQSNRHSTIDTRQTEYHEALPSSANMKSHLTSSFADDGNASWSSVCRIPNGITVGLWQLSLLDGRRPPWYRPLLFSLLPLLPDCDIHLYKLFVTNSNLSRVSAQSSFCVVFTKCIVSRSKSLAKAHN